MSGWAAVAQAASNMFDTWYNNDEAMRRQNDAQQFGWETLGQQQQWAERMRSTQYQTSVEDMTAAGLNPMLSYHMGGAGTPSVSGMSAGIASPGGSEMGRGLSSAFAVDSQIRVNDALIDKTNAERDEIRARTETYPVSIDSMRQKIEESKATIQNLLASAQSHTASAAQSMQQVENLRAAIPQIEATINQLRAQTRLTGSENEALRQKIQANLPELERAFLTYKTRVEGLRERSAGLEMPKKIMESSMYDTGSFTSAVGALGTVMRALSPFSSFISIGGGK